MDYGPHPSPEALEPNCMSPKQPHEEKANILLVDDRPENLLALEAVLGDLGQNLVFANRGEEALKQTLDKDFAVILLDIAMPGMSGTETATLLRQRHRTRAVPIIFLTAFQGTEADLVRSYEAGGVDCLTKPFNPDILRAKVSLFLEIHRQRRDIERQTDLLRRSMLTIVEERRRTAEERKRRQEMEEFAHIASHDLKEPLRAIHTFSQLLLRDYGRAIPPEAREYFDHMLEGATRINSLVDNLIEYAQVSTAAPAAATFDLRDTFDDVVHRLAPLIGRTGARIHAQTLPRLAIPQRQIGLVFEHLLENSLKFRGDQPPEIQVRATAGNGDWLFEVRDNGIGFDPVFAERIFMLFKRLHLRNEYDGTGFGLALCKRIVEHHGGRIWAESELGRGCTVFFTLPGAAQELPSRSEMRGPTQ